MIIIFQHPIGHGAIWMMNGNDMVADYFFARIWAVPAGVMLFGLNGWLTGMQNAVIPMVVAIIVNVIHILFSLWFAFPMGMGIIGIAYASVVAQWAGVALTCAIVWRGYRHKLVAVSWSEVVDMKALGEFFAINRDIFIRTLCVVVAYTFFTAASARMDDPIILAVNTILLELFTLFSYMNDGFAYAAEALTGRFIGARDGVRLRECVKKCMVWCMVVGLAYVGLYVGWWRELLGLFVEDGAADAEQILDYAGHYIGWIIIIPLAASWPFMMDGIMVGATQSRIMRNSMLWATAAYFLLFYSLQPLIGNNALWLAFTSFMMLRGVFQFFMSDSLRAIYRQAEE